MAKWSRQTYEMVANGISWQVKDNNGKPTALTTLRTLAFYFSGQFRADSPRFNVQKFLYECGFGEDSNG